MIQDRADDQDAVFGAITNSDIDESTVPLTKQWIKSWSAYVKVGGDRPPVKPPKP